MDYQYCIYSPRSLPRECTICLIKLSNIFKFFKQEEFAVKKTGHYNNVQMVIDSSMTHIKMGAYHTPHTPSVAVFNMLGSDMGLIVTMGKDFIELEYSHINNSNAELFYHRLKRLYLFIVWAFDSEEPKYSFEEVFPPEEWI